MPIRRSEGGMGGSLGRSNMSHFDDANEVKERSRLIRRQNDMLEIEEALDESAALPGGECSVSEEKVILQARKKKNRRRHCFPLPAAMTAPQVDELFAVLKGQRTLFYYFKDRYALMLLSWYCGKGKSIKEVKASPFGGLFKKTILKEVIARLGGGTISADDLLSLWPHDPECYVLTLGQWGEEKSWWDHWYQTSRPGRNLVLQLNFSNRHRHAYEKLLRPEFDDTFQMVGHPVADGKGYNTLGWARIDFADDLSSALIEEVQTDWLRNAAECRNELMNASEKKREGLCHDWGIRAEPENFFIYYDSILKHHVKIWDEAVLSAALYFLVEDMGIDDIYFHTYEGGAAIKQLEDYPPPRSLYTDLPKRFCFKKHHEPPSFLEDAVRYRSQEENRELKSEFFRLKIEK